MLREIFSNYAQASVRANYKLWHIGTVRAAAEYCVQVQDVPSEESQTVPASGSNTSPASYPNNRNVKI